MDEIKEIIRGLNRESAIVYPPSLEQVKGLPVGLSKFFEICGGLEFNGMVIYGTFNDRIIKHNEDMHGYYEDFQHLIFFGAIDDDIYTYNTQTQKYESRDINGMECWEEYDSFKDFFRKEIKQWLKI